MDNTLGTDKVRNLLSAPIATAGGPMITNVFRDVIRTCVKIADGILDVVEDSDGSEESLSKVSLQLQDLVRTCEQYALSACIRQALMRNDMETAETLLKHPILGPIMMYLELSQPMNVASMVWEVTSTKKRFRKPNIDIAWHLEAGKVLTFGE